MKAAAKTALKPSFVRELAAHGLRVADDAGPSVACAECVKCGRVMTVPAPAPGKKRPAGYWHCANGCNHQPTKLPHRP